MDSKLKLPHGLVSVNSIGDASIREALRKISENIVAVAKFINAKDANK